MSTTTMTRVDDNSLPFSNTPAKKIAANYIMKVISRLTREGKFEELETFLDDLAETPMDKVTEKARNYGK